MAVPLERRALSTEESLGERMAVPLDQLRDELRSAIVSALEEHAQLLGEQLGNPATGVRSLEQNQHPIGLCNAKECSVCPGQKAFFEKKKG